MTLKELLGTIAAGEEVTLEFPATATIMAKVTFNTDDVRATGETEDEFGELLVTNVGGNGLAALAVTVG